MSQPVPPDPPSDRRQRADERVLEFRRQVALGIVPTEPADRPVVDDHGGRDHRRRDRPGRAGRLVPGALLDAYSARAPAP